MTPPYSHSFFRTRILLLGVSLMLLPTSLCAQKNVRQEIQAAKAEIERINRLVGDTRKEQGVTLNHLKLVGTKLESRQKIVQGIETEMSGVTVELQDKTLEVARLQEQYDHLKD